MQLSFDHVGVVSNDLEASTRFYVHLFGGAVSSMGGHTVVVAGDVRIALVPRRDGDPSSLPWGQHVAVRAPAAEREALLARLAELDAPHEEVRGRLYTRDPGGMTLEIVFVG